MVVSLLFSLLPQNFQIPANGKAQLLIREATTNKIQ